jgi:hypothetical protein
LIDDDDPSTERIDIVNSVCSLDMHSLPRKRNSRESCSLKPKAIPPDLFVDLVFRFFSLKTYPGISI